MGPAVEAIDLGKQFPRKQVGQGMWRRLFGRRKTVLSARKDVKTAPDAEGGAEGLRTENEVRIPEDETAASSEGPGDGLPVREIAREPEDDTIVAVKGVSFEVHPGEVFGFLGPNGAGKTTTIRMLATLLEPSTGHAYICGHDVGREAMAARAKLGAVLAGDRSLYWKLSGRENLEYFATLHRVPRRDIPRRIDEVLERMQLSSRADEMVERYSTGMKQRLALARALLADPPVLLLDEPTLGLDPQSARNLRDIVLELKDEGRAILLTTHYMEEADLLSDRIAIIDHGEIIALDAPERLKGALSDERVHRMELVPTGGNGLFKTVADRVPGMRIVEQRIDEGTDSVHVSFTLDESTGTADVWRALAAAETNVVNYSVDEPTLEDVFISLTGRGLRD